MAKRTSQREEGAGMGVSSANAVAPPAFPDCYPHVGQEPVTGTARDTGSHEKHPHRYTNKATGALS